MEPQQSDAQGDDDAQLAAMKALADGGESQQAEGEFDSDYFASLLKNQLIAYNFSWDPLMKALEALANSMARQQRTQKGNNDSLDEMREQIQAMRSKLDESEQHKQDMAAAVAQLQDQVGTLSQDLQTAKQEQDAQRDELQKLKESQSAAPPAVESGSGEPSDATAYASTSDLQDVKQALTNQLRKSLSAVFGDQFVVNEGEEDNSGGPGTSGALGDEGTNGDSSNGGEGDNSSSADGESSSSSSSSRPGTGVSGVLRTPLPGVPFASEAMVKAELAKLRELQAAMEAQLAVQKHTVDALDDKVVGLDARVDAAAMQQQRRNSTPVGLAGPSTDLLQQQINELKQQQEMLLQQLKDQALALDKQASGVKELVASLDDLAVQQTMLSARPSSGGKGPGSSDNGGPPQLDLSLVFTKIADLRRATDASIDQIQQSVRDAADSTSSQQSQLNALRQAAVFNELQKLRLLEGRLALQKELLDRNMTHQDRTKPLLAEWKKQLEQTDEKLQQGACDQDVMDEMQQLQRNYHRTMLTMTPLINSPLTIAESLQRLADEVKDLQSGVHTGIVSGILGGLDGDNRHQRVEEVSTKLRYLDEEVDATQQVNVVTEKKNDPLIKSLDTMRDKLETMWSLWHQNLMKKKRSGEGSASQASTPRVEVSSASSPEALRDLELRLMGAVRRINSLEEEVDRLGALVSASAVGGNPQGAAGRSTDDVSKLRKEMQEEIQRLGTALAGLQSASSSAAPLARANTHSPDQSSSRGDIVSDLHGQMMRRRDVDGRFHDDDDGSGGANGQRTMYDTLLKDLTKKVTQAVMQHAEKSGGLRAGGPAGVGANPNVNFRALLENFTQKFDDRLEDTREFTIEELAKLRKELLDLLKARLESALRDLRAEFMMIYYPSSGGEGANGDTTAMGTKPVMCVACSRPVPVSGMIRDPASYPSADMIAEQAHAMMHAELEYDRNDEDYVYRAGFKMPADRKSMTLPFLANNIRNRIALNKIERKPRRPARQQQGHGNPVDSVVREAMELDRKQRFHQGHPPSPPK